MKIKIDILSIRQKISTYVVTNVTNIKQKIKISNIKLKSSGD